MVLGCSPYFVSCGAGLAVGRKGAAAVSGKWVRASARKKAFGSRLRQAKCSACPTQGWVKSSPHHCRLLSVLRGDVVWFPLLIFRHLIASQYGWQTRGGTAVKPCRVGTTLPCPERGHTAAYRGKRRGKCGVGLFFVLHVKS